MNPLDNLTGYDIILASGSPRRRELLGLLDIPFTVDTSHPVEETVPPGMAPELVPSHLSLLKAMAYPIEEGRNPLVITADTVVILDGEVLGKPADEAAACAMLSMLADNTQKVITGVTIRTREHTETWSCESYVEFGPLSREEIEYYVKKYHPLDKAGAYGIQEWIGAAAIKEIRGSFYNVMGLPVHRLYTSLKKL